MQTKTLKLMLPFSSTTTTHTSSRALAPPVIGHICRLHRLCHSQQLAETASPPACEQQTSHMAGGQRPQSIERSPAVFPALMRSL